MFLAKNVKIGARVLSSRPANALFNPPRLQIIDIRLSIENILQIILLNYRINSCMTPIVTPGFFFIIILTRTASKALVYWNFLRNMSYLDTRETSSFEDTSISFTGLNFD